MSKIPTAEEFYKQTTGCLMNHRDIKKAMIAFAKLHVEAALKEADIKGSEFMSGGADYKEYQQAILDAYPLENIK